MLLKFNQTASQAVRNGAPGLILWSTGTGFDVMKCIAASMVGGIVTSLFIVLLIFPAIYSYWKGWRLEKN